MNEKGKTNDVYGSWPSIQDVRYFWDRNPLWTGESTAAVGTMEFFEEHQRVFRDDCFAGSIDERIFSQPAIDARVLDLGCGIGFWLVEFWNRGFRNITGADLSPTSLDIARKRCSLFGVQSVLEVENAEALTFSDGAFDHVNCQGVVHHTPDTERAIYEIARVLKPGGTASISVYYRNAALRHWRHLSPISRLAAALGGRLSGRGREHIYRLADPDEIVRHYDGVENPIGRAYSEGEFRTIVERNFVVECVYFHFFPARSLPFGIPRALHQVLDRQLPFMMYFNLRRSPS